MRTTCPPTRAAQSNALRACGVRNAHHVSAPHTHMRGAVEHIAHPWTHTRNAGAARMDAATETAMRITGAQHGDRAQCGSLHAHRKSGCTRNAHDTGSTPAMRTPRAPHPQCARHWHNNRNAHDRDVTCAMRTALAQHAQCAHHGAARAMRTASASQAQYAWHRRHTRNALDISVTHAVRTRRARHTQCARHGRRAENPTFPGRNAHSATPCRRTVSDVVPNAVAATHVMRATGSALSTRQHNHARPHTTAHDRAHHAHAAHSERAMRTTTQAAHTHCMGGLANVHTQCGRKQRPQPSTPPDLRTSLRANCP